jgi:hypothetical protein
MRNARLTQYASVHTETFPRLPARLRAVAATWPNAPCPSPQWRERAVGGGAGHRVRAAVRVHSGNPIHDLNIALRASAVVGTAETDLGVALMWASVAANHGVDDAIALRDEIMEQVTGKERARAATLMKDWRAARCGWAEVFPSARNARRRRRQALGSSLARQRVDYSAFLCALAHRSPREERR